MLIHHSATFPYHYGSHATKSVEDRLGGPGKFPYHYGSHATHEDHTVFMSVNKFPYHYGSHATMGQSAYITFNEVSIPLWFSRNEIERKFWVRPTMFPYHYGSHATPLQDIIGTEIS